MKVKHGIHFECLHELRSNFAGCKALLLQIILTSYGNHTKSTFFLFFIFYKSVRVYRSYTSKPSKKQKKGGTKNILPPSPNTQPLYEINQMRISTAIYTLTHIEKLLRNKHFSL